MDIGGTRWSARHEDHLGFVFEMNRPDVLHQGASIAWCVPARRMWTRISETEVCLLHVSCQVDPVFVAAATLCAFVSLLS